MLAAATPDGASTMADESDTANQIERVHELLEEGSLDEALEHAESLLARARELADWARERLRI